MKAVTSIAVLVLVLAVFPTGASAYYYADPYYGGYGYDYSYYYSPYQYYYPQYYYPSYSYDSYGYSGGYSSTPTPYARSYPTGDTDFFGTQICYWEGYGRADCGSNPRQPVYDIWTGTWY